MRSSSLLRYRPKRRSVHSTPGQNRPKRSWRGGHIDRERDEGRSVLLDFTAQGTRDGHGHQTVRCGSEGVRPGPVKNRKIHVIKFEGREIGRANCRSRRFKRTRRISYEGTCQTWRPRQIRNPTSGRFRSLRPGRGGTKGSRRLRVLNNRRPPVSASRETERRLSEAGDNCGGGIIDGIGTRPARSHDGRLRQHSNGLWDSDNVDPEALRNRTAYVCHISPRTNSRQTRPENNDRRQTQNTPRRTRIRRL